MGLKLKCDIGTNPKLNYQTRGGRAARFWNCARLHNPQEP